MEIVIGFMIDCLLGDPYQLPHPIRWIGNLIARLDKALYKENDSDTVKWFKGIVVVIVVLISSTICPALILLPAYSCHFVLGMIVESVMCYYLIAPRCLKDESMKVYLALKKDDVEEARKAVSMIVGRDTDLLDQEGITKAAVETVAENTSDGVTAPLMYMGIGGSVPGFFYKAANTMDSMLGYKNEKYLYFGRCAARLDDLLNYIPARITALIMIMAAPFCGLNGKNALKIWKRDRRKHESPNSAQTEAVCAGALGVRLAGDAYYFGKFHHKETIGDDTRKIEPEDIRRANRLMYVTTIMVLMMSVMIRIIVKKGIRKHRA